MTAAEVVAMLDRGGGTGSFERWCEQVAATGFCRRPVRLSGRSIEVDAETGEIVRRYSTGDEPDGVLLTACNNRRASVCPSCADTYRRDAWQLVAAGLRGGKGVPASVADHPTVFVTLTAPSFGAVHASRRSADRRALACRPRRGDPGCEHGEAQACWEVHGGQDPVVGQPLCGECFDYKALVVWNASVTELWRRTCVYLQRDLARAVGWTLRDLRDRVRVSYVRVSEYQARGAVHLHAVVRLDGVDGGPPSGRFDVEVLTDAIHAAASEVTVRVDGEAGPWFVRWGDELEVAPIGDDLPREAVAAYIAKYATKSTDQFGDLPRIHRAQDLEALAVNDHIAEICRTAWRLGADPALADLKLRRWAHALGFRGHWASKSRHYSTTFGALRDARRDFARGRDADADRDVITLGEWTYAGTGHTDLTALGGRTA